MLNNNNNTAVVHEEKSFESKPLLSLNSFYCMAYTKDIERVTNSPITAVAKKLLPNTYWMLIAVLISIMALEHYIPSR